MASPETPKPTINTRVNANGAPLIRPATYIEPTTGKRLKRHLTLRDPAIFGTLQTPQSDGVDESDDETEPLLPKSGGPAAKKPSSFNKAVRYVKTKASNFWAFCNTETGHNIFKCTIAYLGATLAVFCPPVAAILGSNYDSNQLVGNVVAWFDPARSVGKMELGLLVGFAAFFYGAFIDFGSQATSVFFYSHDMDLLGRIIVLLVFCWGGLGALAWFKHRSGTAIVSSGASLASLTITLCLVKEPNVRNGDFNYSKIVQLLKMLIMGVIITATVNVLIFPVSARKKLLASLAKTTDGFGDSLSSVTACFLSGSEEDRNNPAVIAAAEKYQAAFKSLPGHLDEAKYEHKTLGTERQYYIEKRLVECVQQLAQDLGGLKSAAATQFALRAEVEKNRRESLSVVGTPVPVSAVSYWDVGRRLTMDQGSRRLTMDQGRDRADSIYSPIDSKMHTPASIYPSPNNIFDAFIQRLGPPMKSMTLTIKEVLRALPSAPDLQRDLGRLPRLRNSLADAIELFRNSKQEALAEVYESKELGRKYAVNVAADFEEVAASCGYFSASLEDFAEHCVKYLDILDELELEIHERPNGRSWTWLMFWKKSRPGYDDEAPPSLTYEADNAIAHDTGNIGTLRQAQILEQSKKTSETFPYRLYPYFKLFLREDFKFAFKVGAGATFLAMFAYIPATEPWFHQWRLEWALISYMLVCSMNTGAANTTAWSRSFGTLLGAVLAITAWTITRHNPVALCFSGWVISIGCFYIIVAKGQGPKGRFILLTYNVSIFYTWSMVTEDPSKDEGEWPEILTITFHRFVGVMLGVGVGVVVTHYIWPISARHKVRTGLSLLWLRMGLIWKRAPLQVVLESDKTTVPAYMDIRTETKLREYVGRLDALRKSAGNEFKLKGPFPVDRFDSLIKATTRMLDAFHTLNMIIARDLREPTAGKMELLQYSAKECDDVARRLCHLFSVLASSLNMKYPLTEALPSTIRVRDRLLAKVFEFRQSNNKSSEPTDEDYEAIYCYALVTARVTTEIENCAQEIEQLYSGLGEKVLQLP